MYSQSNIKLYIIVCGNSSGRGSSLRSDRNRGRKRIGVYSQSNIKLYIIVLTSAVHINIPSLVLYCYINAAIDRNIPGTLYLLCTTPGGANHDINNEPQKPRAHCSVSRNISIHHNPPHQFLCVSKVQTLIEWSKN